MEFEENGIGEECGVFGCVAAGEWPTQLDVAQILTLGLVALQHRCDQLYFNFFVICAKVG